MKCVFLLLAAMASLAAAAPITIRGDAAGKAKVMNLDLSKFLRLHAGVNASNVKR